MELLTNSQKSTYQECPKKFSYMYEKGYRPIKEKHALWFGSLIHKCLEQWFNGKSIVEIIDYLHDIGVDGTYGERIDIIKCRELMIGYNHKWKNVKLKTLAVEKEFSIPLINPKTVHTSRTFRLAGKIDAIVETENGECAVVEHKTTSEDSSNPTSNYWLRVLIDPQITGYYLAAESLGYKPVKVIYDVIRKPLIKLALATPEEKRKYKQDGTLYSNQREIDETLENYALRLKKDIEENPDKYFQRKDVVRLEDDLVEYSQDLWSVGKLIKESRNNNYWPKRPNQCFVYGKCQFYDVCAKFTLLDDESMYQQSENIHQELTEVI